MIKKILFIIECFLLKNIHVKLQTLRNNKWIDKNNHITLKFFWEIGCCERILSFFSWYVSLQLLNRVGDEAMPDRFIISKLKYK